MARLESEGGEGGGEGQDHHDQENEQDLRAWVSHDPIDTAPGPGETVPLLLPEPPLLPQPVEVGEDLPLGDRPGLPGDVLVDRGEHLGGLPLPRAPGFEDALLAPEPVVDVLAEL